MLLAVPLLSTGCLKCDMLLELAADGSGYMEVTYSISENAVAQLNSMLKLGKHLDQVSAETPTAPLEDPKLMLFLDPDENKIRDELSKYKKYGLKLDKLRVKSRNARRTVDIRLEFKNIAEVAKADFFSDIGFSLYRRKSGDLVFFRRNMNADNPNKNILADEAAQKMVAPILEGFEVTVKIHTPGKVLDSNAQSHGLTSATWSFIQDTDPKAFQKLQEQEYIILMDGSGVTIPDIKVVTEKQKVPEQ